MNIAIRCPSFVGLVTNVKRLKIISVITQTGTRQRLNSSSAFSGFSIFFSNKPCFTHKSLVWIKRNEKLRSESTHLNCPEHCNRDRSLGSFCPLVSSCPLTVWKNHCQGFNWIAIGGRENGWKAWRLMALSLPHKIKELVGLYTTSLGNVNQ